MEQRGVRMTGDLVELQGYPSRSKGSDHKRAPRGEIAGFSPASRKRLMRLTASFKEKSLPVFITLTYPTEWNPDPLVWKRDLDTFLKALARKFPTYSAIWKLEPQKRGAPHFHLLVFSPDGKPFVGKDWVASKWNRVVKGDEKHFKAGTRVESIRSKRGTMFYVAKYMCKSDAMPEGWEKVGRWWGVMNRKALPIAQAKEMFMHSELEQKAALGVVVDAARQRCREHVYRAKLKEAKESVEKRGDPDDWECAVESLADHLADREMERIEKDEPWRYENSRSIFMSPEEFLRELSKRIALEESKLTMILAKAEYGRRTKRGVFANECRKEQLREAGARYMLDRHVDLCSSDLEPNKALNPC